MRCDGLCDIQPFSRRSRLHFMVESRFLPAAPEAYRSPGGCLWRQLRAAINHVTAATGRLIIYDINNLQLAVACIF